MNCIASEKKITDRKGTEVIPLVDLYNKVYGMDSHPVKLAGSGSARSYFRFAEADGVPSVIGVIGNDVRENRCFIELAGMFGRHGVNVPLIYGCSDDYRCYLQQDLGDTSLFSRLSADDAGPLVEKTLRDLSRLQTIDPGEWDNIVFNRPFGERQIMWDLNYFKYEFLRPSGIVFDEELLEDDFKRLSGMLLSVGSRCSGFMYRDCQSRNVMVKNGIPWWIDFQGGRLGPCLYDAVSMLWQAKAPFDDDFRMDMLEVYAKSFCDIRNISSSEFLDPLATLRLLRALQVLGAYGLRGLVERKAHFLTSIPGALRNLGSLLDAGELTAYPELERVTRLLMDDPRFAPYDADGLTVEVFSFSYKKGYPDDFSGNGGGFMFDCRGMHNPGRYPEYRQLTGMDPEVMAFLEQKGEVQEFMKNACEIVDRSVECYLRRGFSNLQVGFGCTGGQHRSVYCAERMSEHLKARFPGLRVVICHRER